MSNATHTLRQETAGETLVFKPQDDGTVIVDHKFPRGIANLPGVGRMGKVMSKAAARNKWRDAVSVGWLAA